MKVAKGHGQPVVAGGAPDGSAAGPTVLRIGLGSSLRRLRERAGIDQATAGGAIRASSAKISRIETGQTRFKVRDLVDLLILYGVTDPVECDQVLDLAYQANQPGWWHRYNDVLPSWFELYLGLEQDAALIRTFALQFIPELLQTPDYARAMIRGARASTEEIERRIELRMHRQRVLAHDDPPTLWAVIDESVLRRSVCDKPDVLRGQLGYLLEVNERPNVSLQFVPLNHGGHPATSGSFTLLRFSQVDLPDVVYFEQLAGALYLDKRADTEQYTIAMNQLVGMLAPPEDAAAVVQRILHEI
jgi:transcriptional regulator with XRE-family HTH domain